MIIGSILKNTIKILATNPTARKKAGEIAFKAYTKAKPVIKETSKAIKKTLEKKLKSNLIKLYGGPLLLYPFIIF